MKRNHRCKGANRVITAKILILVILSSFYMSSVSYAGIPTTDRRIEDRVDIEQNTEMVPEFDPDISEISESADSMDAENLSKELSDVPADNIDADNLDSVEKDEIPKEKEDASLIEETTLTDYTEIPSDEEENDGESAASENAQRTGAEGSTETGESPDEPKDEPAEETVDSDEDVIPDEKEISLTQPASEAEPDVFSTADGDLEIAMGYPFSEDFLFEEELPLLSDVESPETINVIYKGTYYTQTKDKILNRLNEIRKEACEEGLLNPDTGLPLTPADYRPVKWSSELETIARLRAAEAMVNMGHRRPNGGRAYDIYIDDIRTNAENLAWSYTGTLSVIDAINDWYEEKADYFGIGARVVNGS